MTNTATHIELVHPDKLHRFWPFLKRGLDHVIRKTKPDWIAEDVYAKLATNQASAYVVYLRDIPLGFAVACLQKRMYGDKTDLCVWCGWSLPMADLQKMRIAEDEARGYEDQLMHYLKEVARTAHCAACLIYSPRPGMERRAAKWGYKKALVRYDLPLEG